MARTKASEAITAKSKVAGLIIGLDVGYGAVKAVWGENDNAVIFPSVMGHGRKIKWQAAEISAKHPGELLFEDDGEWFTGELAMMQIPAGELLRLRGRTANETEFGNAFRLRLAKVAIGKLALEGQKVGRGAVLRTMVATGLPVDHMGDASELKKALMGVHQVKTDVGEFVLNIDDVAVMPQPYGTIFSQTLTRDGEINRQHTAKRTGVVDVGTYTIDVALDDEGEYIDAESGSVEGGVYTAQERMAAALEAEHREKFPMQAIEAVLRTGTLRVRGEKLSYLGEVDEALAPMRSATLNLMGRLWKTGANIDQIYLTGGGAALVADEVMREFPQAVVVDAAQTANARGYLNYAKFIQKASAE